MIAARKLSSAMSAAKATCDHLRDWWHGTKDVSCFTQLSADLILHVDLFTVPLNRTFYKQLVCRNSSFLARDSIYAIARYMLSHVRLSVRHTGGSVKNA